MKLRLTILAVALVTPALMLAQVTQPLQKASAPSNPGQAWQLKMTAPLEVGIVCVDMDRMLKFYTEVVGMTKVGDAETTPQMSTLSRGTPYGYRIVRMQTPSGERVKLIQPKVEPAKLTPVPEWVFQRGGMAWITFLIDDMPALVSQMKAHQVKLVSDGAVEVRKGVFALFVLDPEGNYVEFVQYPDIAAYRPDLYKK